MTSKDRLLVVDESLSPRIASELRRRGREARSFGHLGLKGEKDPQALRKLFAWYPRCVLLTSDDSMPLEHADVLQEVGATLATIDPIRPPGYLLDQWERDVAHRWAHAIQAQESGLIKRYTLAGARPWTSRRRRTRRRR